MYLVEINGRQKVIKSDKELQQWVRRGKIDKYTMVTNVSNKHKAYAIEFIESSANTSKSNASKSDPVVSIVDQQKTLEETNAKISKRGYTNFSDSELEKLQSYYKQVKDFDRQGDVNFDDVLILRKHISRIQKEIIIKIAKAKVVERKKDDVQRDHIPDEQKYIRQDSRVVLPPIIPKPRDLPNILQPRQNKPNRLPPVIEGTADEDKWYHEKTIVIAALFLFPPLGLYLLWTSPKMGLLSKIIITGIAIKIIIDAVGERI